LDDFGVVTRIPHCRQIQNQPVNDQEGVSQY